MLAVALGHAIHTVSAVEVVASQHDADDVDHEPWQHIVEASNPPAAHVQRPTAAEDAANGEKDVEDPVEVDDVEEVVGHVALVDDAHVLVRSNLFGSLVHLCVKLEEGPGDGA